MPKSKVEWKAIAKDCQGPSMGGIALCSGRQPQAEAHRWIETLPKSLFSGALSAGSYAVLGLGAGFHVAALADRYPGSTFFVFDFVDELKAHFLQNFSLKKNIEILIDHEIDQFLTSFRPESFVAILNFLPALQWHSAEFKDLSIKIFGTQTANKIILDKDKLDPRKQLIWEVLGELIR